MEVRAVNGVGEGAGAFVDAQTTGPPRAPTVEQVGRGLTDVRLQVTVQDVPYAPVTKCIVRQGGT
eukprot:2556289-Pyramimonas_sp.AAC.1